MHGDGGSDTVTYAGRTPPVFVSIDGVANDGHGGEGDNVQPTVENLVGGKSADQLTGNGSAERAHRRTRRRPARGTAATISSTAPTATTISAERPGSTSSRGSAAPTP